MSASLPFSPAGCRAWSVDLQPPTSKSDRLLNTLPGIWRGGAWAQAQQQVLDTGHGPLNAQLPGGGWPQGSMTELLLSPHARCEWALLLPALVRLLAGTPGHAVLVAPPLEPFMPALQTAGLPVHRLCCIRPLGPGADMAAAWACEQALRCRDVRAVLAWLPQATAPLLRRLQLAAAQHQQLLWVLRPGHMRQQASPAPLRLWLQSQGGRLLIHLLKRRGLPAMHPVALPAHGALLAAVLQAQTQRRQQAQAAAWGMAVPGPQEVADAVAGLAATSH